MRIIIILLLMCNSVFAGDLSEHFSIKEFACHHCGRAIINPKLILMLEELRKEVGKPIKITSGYRCEKHNADVGGVKNSQHTKGTAVDVQVDGMSPDEVAFYAEKVGFKFIKRYLTFTHLDIRGL